MGAVREIRRVVDGKRIVGVRLVPWLWDLPPNDRRYYPVYAACIETGVPFCTQIGHTGPLKRSETGRMLPYLEDVMLDFPELVVVGGHVGCSTDDVRIVIPSRAAPGGGRSTDEFCTIVVASATGREHGQPAGGQGGRSTDDERTIKSSRTARAAGGRQGRWPFND